MSSITDLGNAVAENNVPLVKRMIKEKVDINKTARNGFTPLCIAAFWGSDQIVKLLLEAGADVNVRNHGTRWTPLHCAAFQGHGKVIMYLMQHNPDLYAEDSRRITPVHFASTTEKIWGFFAAKGCTRATKDDLVERGIIRKVESSEATLKQLNDAGEVADPMSSFAGQKFATFSRPGSAYVVSSQNAATSRPASRAGSRPGSGRASRGGSRPSSREEALTEQMNQCDLDKAATFGDVLAIPSPVAEDPNEPKGFDCRDR